MVVELEIEPLKLKWINRYYKPKCLRKMLKYWDSNAESFTNIQIIKLLILLRIKILDTQICIQRCVYLFCEKKKTTQQQYNTTATSHSNIEKNSIQNMRKIHSLVYLCLYKTIKCVQWKHCIFNRTHNIWNSIGALKALCRFKNQISPSRRFSIWMDPYCILKTINIAINRIQEQRPQKKRQKSNEKNDEKKIISFRTERSKLKKDADEKGEIKRKKNIKTL